MSKGKQWWPLGAGPEEAKNAVSSFQERLRERQWIKKNEGPACLYIYVVEGSWPDEDLPSVNAYMQISSHDSAGKNQARSTITRLLSMLNKWHVALRPSSSMQTPPVVFTLPHIDTRFYQYAVMTTLAPDPKKSSTPLTLIVSEHDLSPSYKSLGRRYVMPQVGDSYRWLTTRTWVEQKTKPSFGKWVYGSFTERKLWIEGALQLAGESGGGADNAGKEKEIIQKLAAMGLVCWKGVYDDLASRHLGAYFSSRYKIWIAPEFWDQEAIREWLNDPQTKIAFPVQKPNSGYQYMKKAALAAERPVDETPETD